MAVYFTTFQYAKLACAQMVFRAFFARHFPQVFRGCCTKQGKQQKPKVKAYENKLETSARDKDIRHKHVTLTTHQILAMTGQFTAIILTESQFFQYSGCMWSGNPPQTDTAIFKNPNFF